MATILQLRRGTTVQHSSFTGAVGEVTVDTTKDTVVVHDGTTAGGFPLAKESDISGFITLSDISVTDSGGDGSLSYNNSTGVITYTGPSASDVRAHFSAGTGITITNGAIATTITQYTDALARAAVSVTDSGGDGSLSYNSTTGVITYTGPSATEVRAHFSAGTGITITSGQVAVDTSTIATKTYADSAATTAVAAVIDSAPATLDTLNELAAALGDDANYSATIATALGNRLRVDIDNQSLTSTQQGNALTNLGLTTTLTELNYLSGVTSAVQTQLNAKLASADFNSTFDTRLGTKSTTNLAEGNNLYYTDSRARGAISVTNTAAKDGSISYDQTTGALTYTGPDDADYRGALSAGSGISYDSSSGIISADIYGLLSVNDTGGEGSLSYDNTTGTFTYTGPSANNILDALKTVDGSGSGLDADLLDGQSGSYYRINIYDASGTLLN